jgi:phage-related minor tail protein
MAKVLGFQIEIQGTQRAISTSEELRRAISDIGKELRKATDVETIQKLEKELVDLKARQNEVNKEVRESVKARQAELTGVKQTTGAYAALSKELNDARKQFKDLAAAEMGSSEEAQVLLKRITLLDTKLKDIDGSVGQFQRNVGNYAGGIREVFGNISGIDIASLTTGVGAVVAGFQAFQQVSVFVAEFTAEITKLRGAIQTLTGATGGELDQFTSQVSAITKTFNENYDEILTAANSVSKQLGISFSEALDGIQEGFIAGSNANGEFLDTLREYPTFFKEAGLSADQFFTAINNAATQGIFSDKGVDVIKEVTLRLRELPKATSDALSGIGLDSADIKRKIEKEGIAAAIATVSKRLSELKASSPEVGRAIADIFGGAGEDAGLAYIVSLQNINNKTDSLIDTTNEYQLAQLKTLELNRDLAEVQNDIAKEIGGTSVQFEQLGIIIQTKLLELLASSIRSFKDLAQTVSPLFDLIGGLGKSLGLASEQSTSFSSSLSVLAKAGEVALVPFRSIFSVIKSIKGTFDGSITSIGQFYDTLTKPIQNLFGKQVKNVKTFVDLANKSKGEVFQFGKADEAKAEASAEKVGEASGQGYTKGVVKEIKKSKEEIQAAIDAQNLALEKAARATFRAQISGIGEELQFVSQQVNSSGFAETIISGLGSATEIKGSFPGLSDSIVAGFEPSEQSFDELAKKYEFGFKKIAGKIVPTAKIIGKDVEETTIGKIAKIADAVEPYLNAALDVIGQFQAAKAEKEQEAFAAQIEQIDANIAALEEKQQGVGRIRAKQIQLEIDAAKRQRAAAEKQAEEAQKKAAKREKTLAIIQATIQGAVAVTRALAFPPGPPATIGSAIATGVFAAAQVAAIAAQPLATGGVVGISGRRVTDGQNMPTRSNGDNVLATVKRGEVVLNQRQQSALGGARVFRSIGVPGFADGGAIGAPNISATVAGENDRVIQLIEAVNGRIDRLQAYVVSDDVARDLAERDSLRVNASL